MPDPIIFTSIHDVTPERLTAVLNHPVIKVETRDNPAFNSQVFHLEVTYTSDTPPTPPRKLLLKLNGRHHGKLEVDFYRYTLSLSSGKLPIPTCLHAAYEPFNGDSHLLLEDLSENYSPPISREQLRKGDGVPTAVHLNKISDSLAKFHAYWWQHPQLGTGDSLFAIRPWYSDEDHYRAHIERRQQEWAQFLATVAKNAINPKIFDLFPAVLKKMPDLWSRLLEPRLSPPLQITLSHGDCYLTQFLCPEPDTNQPAVLVDFDSVSGNFAPYDLVYLLTTFWTPEQRRQHERSTLHRYHQSLQASGVQDYPWDQLWHDYRLMILFMIFDPIWDQTNGSPSTYWQPKLHCLTAAFWDLNCDEFLVASGR